MWSILAYSLVLGVVLQPQQIVLAAKDTPQINSKSFQMHFLNEIMHFMDNSAARYLDQLLENLQHSVKSQAHAHEFAEAQQSSKLEHKVVFIKQLLDECDTTHEQTENFYALRNVNFLKRLRHKFRAIQEESAQEIHHLRIYQLCRQFQEPRATTTPPPNTITGLYAEPIKLAPIRVSGGLSAENQTKFSVNLSEFGHKLYDNMNGPGSDIIDDYLNTIRKLLHEVIDEKPEHAPEEIAKLKTIINEIDDVLSIHDLYDKRNRVYSYLQSNLTAHYEQLRTTQQSRLYLDDILLKLKMKGMDLFFAFLFSNFEFLERLHEEWANLLPPKNAHDQRDESTEYLYSILELYEAFKRDPEKYEKFVVQVKRFYTQTLTLNKNDGKIYELHHNSVLNLGSITLNMIRAKCDEI